LQCTAPTVGQSLMWLCDLFGFVWWKAMLT